MVGRFSEEEKARFAEERRLQLQKMHADVADKVAELVNGDAWQEWLSVAAMFHRYPVRPDRQIVGRSVARPAVDDETADASTRARRVPESFRALALSPVTRRSVLLGRSWGSPPGVQGGSSNEAQHRTRGCEVADPLDSEVVHRQGAKGAGQRGGVAVVGRETVPGKDGHPGRPADDHGLEVAERDHGADTDGPDRVSLLVGLPHRDPHHPCTDAAMPAGSRASTQQPRPRQRSGRGWADTAAQGHHRPVEAGDPMVQLADTAHQDRGDLVGGQPAEVSGADGVGRHEQRPASEPFGAHATARHDEDIKATWPQPLASS